MSHNKSSLKVISKHQRRKKATVGLVSPTRAVNGERDKDALVSSDG